MALKKPVDFDELYPGRFLKAGELRGAQVTLTIEDVNVDELESDDGGKKVKGVVSFQETSKQLCLNKTNGLCLRGMFGRTVAGWVGKRVTLFTGVHKGEPCVRIWGSPDIDRELNVTIQLPRKKPVQMTMHKTVKGAKNAPATEDAPPPVEA